MRLHQPHRQPVAQREALHRREGHRRRRARGGDGGAPRLGRRGPGLVAAGARAVAVVVAAVVGHLRRGRIVDGHPRPRRHLDHDPPGRVELAGSEALHLLGGDRRRPAEVVADPVGVAEVVVVEVQLVGQTAEAAEVVEVGDAVGDERRRGRLDLGRRGAVAGEVGEFGIDGAFQLGQGVARLGRGRDGEHRGVAHRLDVGRHRLGDPQVVDEPAGEAAGPRAVK